MIHLDKTNIPSKPEIKQRVVNIDNITVQILLPGDKAKYLGQTQTCEQQSRIRIAWSSSAKHRQELTSRSYMLRHRLRVFDAVITPSMLRGGRHMNFLTLVHEKLIRWTLEFVQVTNRIGQSDWPR